MIDTFLSYIQDFIEKPNDAFGGLPVCPFARPARLKKKLLFVLTNDFSPLHIVSLAHKWGLHAIHTDALVLLFSGSINWTDFETLCEAIQNDPACSALEVFAGHPDSPIVINGVFTRKDPVINLQFNRKDLLNKLRKSY
jgi:hypothetical protein